MKKYLVRIPYFCKVLAEVEAQNPEEAEEKALSEVFPSLCHECSNTIEMNEMNDEADRTVEEI